MFLLYCHETVKCCYFAAYVGMKVKYRLLVDGAGLQLLDYILELGPREQALLGRPRYHGRYHREPSSSSSSSSTFTVAKLLEYIVLMGDRVLTSSASSASLKNKSESFELILFSVCCVVLNRKYGLQ